MENHKKDASEQIDNTEYFLGQQKLFAKLKHIMQKFTLNWNEWFADKLPIIAFILSIISLIVALLTWLLPRNPPERPFVNPPEISTIATSTGVDIYVISSQPGATTYFTVDGSHPSRGSSGPYSVTTTEPVVVKAIAVFEDIKSIEAHYVIRLNQVPPPNADRASRSVVSVGEEITLRFHHEATLFYTIDGTDPYLYSDLYTSPILITEDVYIRVRAFLPGHVPSDIVYFRFAVDGSRAIVGEDNLIISMEPPETAERPQASPQPSSTPRPQPPTQADNFGIQVAYTNENYTNIGGIIWPLRWPTVRVVVTTDFDVERVTLQSNLSPEFTVDMTSINPRLWEHDVEFRITDTVHVVTVVAYVSDGQVVSQQINIRAGSERP